MKQAGVRLRRLLLEVGMPAAVLVTAVLVIYGSSLNNKFVSWDDTGLIYNNPVIRGLNAANVKQAFSMYDPELYIPLTFVSWQFDYMAGGLQPFMYHFGNMVLHALCALLTLLFVRKVTGKPWLGWMAGLLFAVHPLHVEAVAWASARKDVLSAFFALASMTAYAHYAGSGRRGIWWLYGASVALFALALMAKVSVVMVPVLLVALDWMRRRPMSKAAIADKVPYVTLSVVFGIVALFGKKQILAETGTWEKILMAGKSTVFYLQKLLVPIDLTVIYPYVKPITLSSPDFWVPAALSLGLVALTVWLALRWREAAFCLAFFLLNIIPSFTNFAKDGELYVASDRYAYIASIGIFVLAGLLLERLAMRAGGGRSTDRFAGIAATSFAAVAMGFGLLAAVQTTIWRDSETLFRDVIRKQPDSIAAHLNLAIILRETGRLEEALAETHAALAIHPRMEVYTNFANVYKLQGRTELAAEQYRIAAASYPEKPEPHMGLGIIAQEQGRYDEAIAAYRKAIGLEPKFTAAYVNLASTYEHLGRYDEAEAELKKALDISPSFADGWYSLGVVQIGKKDFPGATASFRKAMELNPGMTEAAVDLAASELTQGRPAEALEILKAVLRKDPENAGAKALVNEMARRGIIGTK